MAFKKGQGRLGGRQKGTPNKDRAMVRTIVEAALGHSIPDELLQLRDKMTDPRDKADILQGLMPYAYPKLSSVEHSGDIGIEDQSEVVRELTEELIRITGREK